ncbi:MAG TPA: helix-turn-helix domain-containing protein, partial [Saprospiraceae bacterium]|nr:helix-turn-helix domain-containing protein [Saprospiraceae bacterium]
MKNAIPQMKPQDVLILLRILKEGDAPMTQTALARSLFISQSEVSQSLGRSIYAGLIAETEQSVMKGLFMDFLRFGIAVTYPARPGSPSRGVRTAHSAPPLADAFVHTNDIYVWSWAKGDARGHGIPPLYPTVPQVAMVDPEFHEWLALVDALRIGRTRERNMALEYLEARIQEPNCVLLTVRSAR